MATVLPFKLEFKLPEKPAVVVTAIQQKEIDTSPVFFTPTNYPKVEKTELEIVKEQHDIRNNLVSKKKPLQITSYEVGKVRIVYNGESYEAHMRKPMLQDGFKYWKTLYEKEIAYARAICYAKHVMLYGNFGQSIPPIATEYLTITEAARLKMEEQIRLKDVTFDLDIVPKVIKSISI